MPPPTPPDTAEAAIRATRARQNEAIARGDFDAVETCWTDDITIRRALGHAVTGIRQARDVLVQASLQRPALVYQRRTASVFVSGTWPLAYEDGEWSAADALDPHAPWLGGRYAAHWVCRDGRWLIRAELFVALDGQGPGAAFEALP